MSDIVTLARRHKHVAPTHYEGCEVDHIGCLVNRLADEIEGLRAENERLFNEDTKTRHALKGWVFVCPDGGDEPTHERVAAVVAEVERQRAEIERHRAENEKLRADNERLRKALQDIAEDCDDDYPPSHGAIKYSVQDALRDKP